MEARRGDGWETGLFVADEVGQNFEMFNDDSWNMLNIWDIRQYRDYIDFWMNHSRPLEKRLYSTLQAARLIRQDGVC